MPIRSVCLIGRKNPRSICSCPPNIQEDQIGKVLPEDGPNSEGRFSCDVKMSVEHISCVTERFKSTRFPAILRQQSLVAITPPCIPDDAFNRLTAHTVQRIV